MSNETNSFLKVKVDNNTKIAFKKILKVKNITVQKALKDMINNYILSNLKYLNKEYND